MASTFEVFKARSAQSTPQQTPTFQQMEGAGFWFSQPRPYVQKAGIRAYQQAPVHLGMMHPPQSETVRRDLLQYLEANGITKPQPRTVASPSAPDLRPRATPRWRPSGLVPVRQPSLGVLPPDPQPRKLNQDPRSQSKRPAPKVLHLRRANDSVDARPSVCKAKVINQAQMCIMLAARCTWVSGYAQQRGAEEEFRAAWRGNATCSHLMGRFRRGWRGRWPLCLPLSRL